MNRSLLCTITAALLLSAVFLAEPTSAQISISSLAGGSYTQNFDSLASSGSANTWTDNSTLPGWYAATNASGGVAVTYKASTGTDQTGMMYSFGTNGVNPASDRALGSIASNTSGALAYGVRFANDTGSAINSITISYTGEQWRNNGNPTAQTLSFSYRGSATPITNPDPANTESWTPFTALDFTTPTASTSGSALDGNASTNRVVFSGILLTGAAVPAGAEIFLRWRDVNDSGNDHAVAIDDLTVTFGSGAIATNAPSYASVTPPAQTNRAGTSAAFTVTSDGAPSSSLSYQWRKDGAPLVDSGNLYGSTTPTLTVSNVLAADAAGYDVVVANSAGSVTSAVARLAVIDPVVSSQSADQNRFGGDSATLTVTAKGTPTLAYQWFFGSAPIDGGTGSALPLLNLRASDQGTYTCWVTNGLGASVASAPITLTVTVLPGLTLALWDFNDTNAPVASPPPAIGVGTASLLNGVTATFAGGVSADHGGTNDAWNTAHYPPQGTSNQTAGVQFSVSTVGYQNICLMWYQRQSSTASKYTRLQYTTDGSTFSDLNLNAMAASDTFVLRTRDLSAIPAVNNNPQFAFRMVAEFESDTNSTYVGTSGSYSSGGTIRLDLVGIYGDLYSATTPLSTTISNIAGTRLTYGGGGGSQFVLLKSTSVAAPLSGWARVATNTATPGTFTVPTGTGNAAFYRIRSE